ncbi:antiviral RADAR system adenosine triphosphatase RdrA [Pseudomonas asplenii]|uniref:antiviral RADAR system adenosine triphosphatase RdrA n=1 Tax=Pseudomonas asplenii TaxID=53407 RepID=UPI002362E5E9|nr:antiviral RADAR system adenosine triphosphatase RdrA [Pseudomonas asplenii]
MIDNETPQIELPIDQSEQARQPGRQNLLAQDVYRKIKEHLKNSLEKLPGHNPGGKVDLDENRSHEAILIDGGRGTGKSSVLVNLTTYLHDMPELLILKPVDPTLLENGDDLLLNVIVAALMRDKTVQMALQNNESAAESFYDQLHKLGAALEGIQKQKEQYGLDKLRSFMGNQALAEQVHELFKKTLELTRKKLVVLPIDDVDTSLQLAFENVEVVRKYLTSPYVAPLISGDLSLYNEVIWREFYSRLTNKAEVIEGAAQRQARDLAEEYQRKILPFPKRIQLPLLSTYLKNSKIVLTEKGTSLFPLPVLEYWLDALLNERVNGEENSHQAFPLRTIREMAQFINATQTLISKLKENLQLGSLNIADPSLPHNLKRLMFMSREVSEAVQDFEKSYREAFYTGPQHNRKSRTAREHAYQKLQAHVSAVSSSLPDFQIAHLQEWYSAIVEYFRYQRKGGVAFLTADTNLKWMGDAKSPSELSVLRHDLFQPFNHRQKIFDNFEKSAETRSNWTEALKKHFPEIKLEHLPERTILAYPAPERGRPIGSSRSGPWALDDYVSAEYSGKAEFVRRLMIHWGFYSSNQRSNLVLRGRLFELMITTLIRNITATEVMQILNRAPYHSTTALTDTKPLNFIDDLEPGNSKEIDETSESDEQDELFKEAILSLTEDVNHWRKSRNIKTPHSWLIYNVMNKFFSQAESSSLSNNKPRKEDNPLLRMVEVGIQAFDSLWAAFGSFEKSEIFGFPQVIANVSMTEAHKDFEKSPLYRQNILPFLQNRKDDTFFDFKTNSYTFALESHPLRFILNDTFFEFAVPLSEIITRTNLSGLTVESDKSPEALKIDRIFNETARKHGVKLQRSIIQNLPLHVAKPLVDDVMSQCYDAGLEEKYNFVIHDTNLPPRSGRQNLQLCIERIADLTNISGPRPA